MADNDDNTTETQLITLRNGDKAVEAVVINVMEALRRMVRSPEPVVVLALNELWKSANDRSYQINPVYNETICRFGLDERFNADGTLKIHDSVRSIV